MAIVVSKRPNDKCWSGNPIHYQLYSAAAEADSTIVFEVMVLFKRTDAIDYSEIVTLPYNPVMGIAKLDIQDILDGLLEYETPGIPDDNEYAGPSTCRKQTGKFYVKFREITAAVPDPPWTTGESDFERFIIKGGISFQKWRGDNYWVNYYEPLKPFLTWQLSGRLASKKERMYLAWYNHTNVDESDIKMRRTAVFNDGSEQVVDLNSPLGPNEVIFFPSGYDQLKLGDIDPTKRVQYWEMQMWDINLAIPISQLFRINLDNRNDKNEVTLNYRNSLGGLDSARIRGVIETNLERNFEETESIVNHNYFEGNHINPKVKAANSTETVVYKGDMGFLSKEEQDRLRDAHFRRECWWEQEKKWLPVRLRTTSQKLKSSTDQLWSMPIEFSLADGGEKFYTPANVNLADGAIPNVVLCNAVISDPTVEVDGTQYHVDWNLVSGAPAKYQVSTAAIAGGAPYETIDTEYTYAYLPPGDHTIRVTPLCLIGGVYLAGVPKEVNITVAAACVGVGIVGAPSLPNATVGKDYASFITLSGTAPFALANVVKPSWMTIAIAGNTVNFSGIPAPADEGIDIEVSFDVTNCGAGNSVSFEDAIDVEDPEYNFNAQNPLSSCLLNEVTPSFYLVDTGSFPITPGNEVNGYHTGFTGAISFNITIFFGSVKIELYKNGVLNQSITTAVSGYHSFTSVAFAAGDTIQIKTANP